MGYAVYNLKGRKSDAMEFEEAARMVEEGLECMRELAEDMKEQYGMRRGGYGMRGDYGRRDDWDEMDDMYGMRRRRDSRGRYM
jgi:hypothetical protein